MNKSFANISVQDIKVVDFYITDGEWAMADVSVQLPEIYYCLGTEDTREDGHVTLSDNDCNVLMEEIVNALKANDDIKDISQFTIKLAITYCDGTNVKLTESEISVTTLRALRNTLAYHCDELMFLHSFK